MCLYYIKFIHVFVSNIFNIFKLSFLNANESFSKLKVSALKNNIKFIIDYFTILSFLTHPTVENSFN